MKKQITLIVLLFTVIGIKAQVKDTVEVQKIGDKYFIVMDHPAPVNDQSVGISPIKKSVSDFMMVGLGTVGYINTWSSAHSNSNPLLNSPVTRTNSFGDADRFEFSPMFLWRHSNNILIEFEPSFNGGADGTFNIDVNWADIHYYACPGLMIRAGYFVLPFGIYNKRLAAGWIDKLPSDPVSLTNFVVNSDWGVGLAGGFGLGNMKINYDVSLTNGFNLSSMNPSGTLDGSVSNPGIVDNNNGKTVCGRFGWLPISNSSLEIGVSGLYGKAGDAGNSMYKRVATAAGAADLQYIFSQKPISINIKAQYNILYVTKANYFLPTDTQQVNPFTFNNITSGWFGQVSFRPVVTTKVLRNFELAFRYSHYDTPKNSTWEQHSGQTGVSLDYWINWRTVVKLGYENLVTTNPSNAFFEINDLKAIQNMLQVQCSVQF